MRHGITYMWVVPNPLRVSFLSMMKLLLASTKEHVLPERRAVRQTGVKGSALDEGSWAFTVSPMAQSGVWAGFLLSGRAWVASEVSFGQISMQYPLSMWQRRRVTKSLIPRIFLTLCAYPGR